MPKTQRSKNPLREDSGSSVNAAIMRGMTCAEINAKGLAVHVDGSKGLSTTAFNYRKKKLGLVGKVSKSKGLVSKLTTPDTPEVIYRDLETGAFIEHENDIKLGMTFAEYRLNRKGSASLQLVYSKKGGKR
jgi:hypothetical protein